MPAKKSARRPDNRSENRSDSQSGNRSENRSGKPPGAAKRGGSRPVGAASTGSKPVGRTQRVDKPRAEKPRGAQTRSTKPRTARSDRRSSETGGDESSSKRIRLQRALAAAGFGSRRQCEELILEGRIEVDGAIVDQLGSTIDPSTSKVFVDGTPLKSRRLVYYIVNKPSGVVTTNADPEGRPRVIDLVPPDERVFPVGRLDRSSEGLILLTNDGDLAQRLAHPKYEVEKVYRVTVAGNVQAETVKQMHQGIYIAEGLIKVEGARVLKARARATEMEITLKEGKNREIRRILARLGHKVQTLKRIAIGTLKLGEMPTGAYRRLSVEEIRKLKTFVDSTAESAEESADNSTAPRKSPRPSKKRPGVGRSEPRGEQKRSERIEEDEPVSARPSREARPTRELRPTRESRPTARESSPTREIQPKRPAAKSRKPMEQDAIEAGSGDFPTPGKRAKRERSSDRFEDSSEPLIRLPGIPRRKSGIVIGAESPTEATESKSPLPIELANELPDGSRRGRRDRSSRFEEVDDSDFDGESEGNDRRGTKSGSRPGAKSGAKPGGKPRGKRVGKTIVSNKASGGIKVSRSGHDSRVATDSRPAKSGRGDRTTGKPRGQATAARPDRPPRPGKSLGKSPGKKRPGGRGKKGD